MQNEGISLANAAQLRAGNFQRHRFRAAKGKEDGIMAAPQRAGRNVPPENNAHAEFNAALPQGLHAPFDHRPIHLETRQPVDQPSARRLGAIDDRDRVTLARKGVRPHQAAQARTDDGDALSGGGRGRGFFDAVRPAVIEQEAGDRADGDWLGGFGEDTSRLAHAFFHADVSDEFWQALGVEKKLRRVVELAVGGEGEQIGYGNFQGAGGHAVWMRALDAAAGLLAGGRFVVRPRDLMEVREPVRHRTLGRFNPVQFAPGVFGSGARLCCRGRLHSAKSD